ncbi:formylglycine-generating enzyme family protein [Caenispirillum salinarum]|uniref:formylglycine-generating enzyme family protein n=1 Tax=Caenispirillum salinarum TaxID=859058 RepID=UPI00385090E8
MAAVSAAAALVATGLGGQPAPAAAADAPAIEWPERLWNPKPADDDVILPMPCGGAMAFRKVPTTLPGNWLTDDRVRLGSPHAEVAFASYLNRGHVAGSLSENSDPATRHLLVGKYEVTADQYAAVIGGECGRPGMMGRLPKDGVSWFDAVHFGRAYTEWLLQNARESLPHEDGDPAFIRLPTETEWEFAARGGRAVTEDDFMAPRFPMDGDISRWAWFQGASSCQGHLQPVGLLEPNPLGLHDILGNVEEIMLEPFRMVRVQRHHGQVGGMVSRGGSCLTDRGMLTTSSRTEANYFNPRTGQARTPEMTGFRMVVAAPVQVSHERIAELREDWESLSDGGARAAAADAASRGPAEALEAAAGATSDVEAEQVMRDIAAAIREDASDRADVERRAVQAAIQSGALIIRQYRDELRRMENIEKIIAIRRESTGTNASAQIAEAEQTRDYIRQRLKITQSVYTTVLGQTAEDYPVALLADQSAIVGQRLRDVGAESMAGFAQAFVGQVERWAGSGGGDIEAYLEELGGL